MPYIAYLVNHLLSLINARLSANRLCTKILVQELNHVTTGGRMGIMTTPLYLMCFGGRMSFDIKYVTSTFLNKKASKILWQPEEGGRGGGKGGKK